MSILSQTKLVEFVKHHQVDDILLAILPPSKATRLIIEKLWPLNKHIRTFA